MGYGPGGSLTVTAADRWAVVQRAGFERVRQTSGNAVESIVDLVLEVLPDTQVVRRGTFTTRAPTARWEDDRDGAIATLANAANVDVAFDPLGRLLIRPVPSLAQGSAWTVDAATVLLNVTRSRSRQRTYNVVIVRAESVDGTPPFAPVVVEDDDPNSETYADGPFGRVPYIYSSPLLRSSDSARQAGETILARVKALAYQLSLDSVVNPALDAGDVVAVLFPPSPETGRRLFENHVLDSVTIPLGATGSQSMSTRSSRATDETNAGSFGGPRTWADLMENATWGDVRMRYATWGHVLSDQRRDGL
jgi:hypothetical protein